MIQIPNAQVYRVGGCVRDDLLGIHATDNDYVVVGSNTAQMLSLGFTQVGKNFPVFLHPTTHEEYALARSEKKVGAGYTGFSFDTNDKITLLDDLSRRDLTINAIAQDEHGHIIDPFGGILDLKNQVLRHVSHAFVEDPLRVLRIARFQARFNFTIADETMLLIHKIVKSNELTTISKERIWGELHKALLSDFPLNFFNLLGQIGAFEQILTEFNICFQNPLEINWLRVVCEHMVRYKYTLNERLAILFYLICQYKDYDNEQTYTDLGLNRKAKKLGQLLIRQLPQIYKLSQLTPEEIYTLISILSKTDQEESKQQFIKLATHIAQITKTEVVFFKQMITTNLLLKAFSNINYLELLENIPKKQQAETIRQFKLFLINHLSKQLN